jgi:hypothetical protein
MAVITKVMDGDRVAEAYTRRLTPAERADWLRRLGDGVTFVEEQTQKPTMEPAIMCSLDRLSRVGGA